MVIEENFYFIYIPIILYTLFFIITIYFPVHLLLWMSIAWGLRYLEYFSNDTEYT